MSEKKYLVTEEYVDMERLFESDGMSVAQVDAWLEAHEHRERTCHIVWRDETGYYEDGGAYACDACSAELPDFMQTHWDDIQAGSVENDVVRCPSCGAVVVER